MEHFVFSQTLQEFIDDHSQDLVLFVEPDTQNLEKYTSYLDMVTEIISERFNIHKTTTNNLQSVDYIPCKEENAPDCYIVQKDSFSTASEQLKIDEVKDRLQLRISANPCSPPYIYFIYDNNCIGEDGGYTPKERWEKGIRTIYCHYFLLNLDNTKLYCTNRSWISLTENKFTMQGIHELSITCNCFDGVETTSKTVQTEYEFSSKEEAEVIYSLLNPKKSLYHLDIFLDMDSSECRSFVFFFKNWQGGRTPFLTVRIWKNQSNQLRIFVLEPNDNFEVFKKYREGISYIQTRLESYLNTK